ncbi:MAG TPA: protein kinase [Isosphaeraceae bacterium]|nr:protein kinase [Isosphaeraceae bacterium]
MIADRVWDDADSLGPALLARRFEAAWRADGRRPDPADYLPAEPDADPAALLAVLRADLALRWEAGEPARVESYLGRFPRLGGAVLVALLYEEYCLREEAGAGPDRAEYEARFPEAAAELRQVLEIHSLVRNGRSTAPAEAADSGPTPPPFPEVGQTIAGFRLVEELGRGSFARVFRAEERPLADRPVALKVTRAGSREPQALARLQHTHIVPIHSYRTDPATGLHLLCMPYLGRTTLAQVLAHPDAASSRSGADLVALLDRLRAADDVLADRPAGRRALARRGFARAIAWWGARLAEALQHAHDRGVLHRDVKPSNVLITADGLPMLLDFNLAHESWGADATAAPTAPGGTLAYMAPEHLEALAVGAGDRVDGRADVYALGVVLFEALTAGRRPFEPPAGGSTVLEALRRAAADRRAGAPRLRAIRPDLPAELEAVLRRCLEPDPAARYANPAELAADLQAVADDAPLRFAVEPWPGRVRRWARRHRRRLALAAPVVLALGALVVNRVESRLARARLRAEVEHRLGEAASDFRLGRLDLAAAEYDAAARLAEADPGLNDLRDRSASEAARARLAGEVRGRADAFSARAEAIRFGLLGFGSDPATAAAGVEELLGAFGIPDDPSWHRRPALDLLDPPRRERLRAEAEGLMFLWVFALDHARPGDPETARQSRRICDAVLSFAEAPGPWRALRGRYEGGPRPSEAAGDPAREGSAAACFQWALLCHLDGRPEAAIAWLERAIALRPGDYWAQFYLGYRRDDLGRVEQERGHRTTAAGLVAVARERYSIALALRPGSRWALYNRARLDRQAGDLERALDGFERAVAAAGDDGFPEALLNAGIVRDQLGDDRGARARYERLIASRPGAALARAARMNLAKLDLKAGDLDRARLAYDALLAADDGDANARLGRALLDLRTARPEAAEAGLTLLLRPGDLDRLRAEAAADADEVHALRALARLALGRPAEALGDAEVARGLRGGPARDRLRVRALLAAGRDLDLIATAGLDDPDELDRLPAAGPRLAADLRAAIGRLRPAAEGPGPAAVSARLALAVALASLGDSAAEIEASRAVAAAGPATEPLLVRARVRRRLGDRRGALADVDEGLRLAPGEPRLLELRGRLQLDLGRPELALTDLDLAIARGTTRTAFAARAWALLALGPAEAAAEDAARALAFDPEDAEALLVRARASARLRRWARALNDLEEAADRAGDRPALLARIAAAYASILPARPERFARVLVLARRSLAAWRGPPS